MKSKWLLHKLFVIFILLATLFALGACTKEGQAMEPGFPATAFVSSTDLYNLMIPIGWSTQEVIPGADVLITNTEAALERYTNNDAIESGDTVLNVGFLPLALLQEKELAHLGFQFKASPEVFLQSLLPMFRIGNESAVNVAGEVTLVSLGNGRDAGMLTFSEEGREGLILVFAAGDDVFSFVSAIGFPGEMEEFQEITFSVAAGVTYNGSQDALYKVLYGD